MKLEKGTEEEFFFSKILRETNAEKKRKFSKQSPFIGTGIRRDTGA